jgi:hypothetical protein
VDLADARSLLAVLDEEGRSAGGCSRGSNPQARRCTFHVFELALV